MKISIVIPTYNQGKYIHDCLQSLISQTYSDLEIVIQDAGSEDDSEKICRELARRDQRVGYYRERDEGQSDGINRGLKKSGGEFWTWIGSDDRLHNPEALAKLVDTFRQRAAIDGRVVGVYGQAFFMDGEGQICGPYLQMDRDLQQYDFNLSWPLSQPASLLLRKRVIEVGGVDSNLHLGMDLDLFIRMLEGDRRFVYSNHAVADVRVHEDSKSVRWKADTAVSALAIVQRHFGSIGNPSRSAFARELRHAVDDGSDEVMALRLRLQESEADRAARLESIHKLTQLLQESEADRAARLESIQKLTHLLRESEVDRAARLSSIQKLTRVLHESELSNSLAKTPAWLRRLRRQIPAEIEIRKRIINLFRRNSYPNTPNSPD